MKPRARKAGLVIRRVEDELLVYDLGRHHAHCLNPAAALVFEHCDGRTGVDGLRRLLRAEGAPADDRWVWLALDRLSKARLLEQDAVLPAAMERRLSRRDLLRRTGQVAGLTLLLPTVTSIVAPTPAEAAFSCIIGFGCFGQPAGTPCYNSFPSDCGGTCACTAAGVCEQVGMPGSGCG